MSQIEQVLAGPLPAAQHWQLLNELRNETCTSKPGYFSSQNCSSTGFHRIGNSPLGQQFRHSLEGLPTSAYSTGSLESP